MKQISVRDKQRSSFQISKLLKAVLAVLAPLVLFITFKTLDINQELLETNSSHEKLEDDWQRKPPQPPPVKSLTNRDEAALKDNLQRSEIRAAEIVWTDLIEEGARLLKDSQSPGAVMEVGMHRAFQCVAAAEAGLQAHCVEPSPKSFKRVTTGVKKAPADVQKRIHLYNVAAGGSSEGSVPFTHSGGTGDHVGEHNMWTMENERPAVDEKAEVIQVPSIRLDDIVKNQTDGIFLLKVDTQGFEPAVFSGLTESLKTHKIKYILTEYWPRGMDLLAGKKDVCVGAQLLQEFTEMGYTLYSLGVQAHPRAPKGWQSARASRPLDNLVRNCRWYFEVEERFPSDEYKMGYWSDILAVAPNANLGNPVTKTGKALQEKIP
jgi:FkbM family methyltransferase